MKKSATFEGIFADFIMTRKAKGLSDKTITTYNQHFRAISKHIDINNPIDRVSKLDLEKMIASMRDACLAPNSIKSYTHTLKSFSLGVTRKGFPLLI